MPFILAALHNKMSNEFTDKKLKFCNAVKKIKTCTAKCRVAKNAKKTEMD